MAEIPPLIPVRTFEVLSTPGEYCFAGNPVIIRLKTNLGDPIDLRVRISNGSTQEVWHRFFPYLIQDDAYYLTFDLSNMLKSYFSDISFSQSQVITPQPDFLISLEVFVKKDDETEMSVYSGKTVNGGISKNMIYQLANSNLNMFSYRLNNPLRQFLFTTRTNSYSIPIRETELYPFIFIAPETSVTFVTRTGRTLVVSLSKGDAYYLDVNILRKTIFDLYNELPSYFAVIVNGSHSFSILLVSNKISDESYIFLFKNSLGGYEKIECTGKATDTPEFAEDKTWNEQDGYGSLREARERLVMKETFTVESGYKIRDELLFILDLVASDEIYLILPDNRKVKCHINAESLSIDKNMVTPGTIKLKVRMVYDESYLSPELDYSYPENIFTNITRPGYPELNGYGLIYGDDNAINAE